MNFIPESWGFSKAEVLILATLCLIFLISVYFRDGYVGQFSLGLAILLLSMKIRPRTMTRAIGTLLLIGLGTALGYQATKSAAVFLGGLCLIATQIVGFFLEKKESELLK